MKLVSDIMSAAVQTIEPQETLRRAARAMQEQDVGALPVCQEGRLLGVLTDRDIVVRGIAAGMDPDTACVSDLMTLDVEVCTPLEPVDEVMRRMGERQIRRLPVVDGERRLVGIVALADLALRQEAHTDRVLTAISAPGYTIGQGGT